MATIRQTSYFIADQHFGIHGETSKKFKKFANFIDYVKGSEALFIVGDLFDFYFEYKSQSPKHHLNILAKLKDLRNSGTEIHYIVGNHDFWVGDFFTKELDIKVYKKPVQIILQGKNIFISHGNDFTRIDLVRWLLRNKISIYLFSLLPPGFAQSLGSLVSRTSALFSKKKKIRWKTLYNLGEKKFKSGTDIVILAHIHSPKFLDFKGKKLVILGDWIKNFSYGKLENGEFKLCFL